MTGKKERAERGMIEKSWEEWLCITCLRQSRDPLLFIKITFTFQHCLCCKQSAYSAAAECAFPKKPPPLSYLSTHTDIHTHTHPSAVSCLCKVICRGEDDCSPSWWPWQRLTACIHRWRWMQWVRSAAGVSCLFQGTLALMTWLIACPGSAEPLINQAADWIQSFASPAHWWTGKDAGPGADTWPAQGLGSFSSMSAPLTAAWQPALTVSPPDCFKKKKKGGEEVREKQWQQVWEEGVRFFSLTWGETCGEVLWTLRFMGQIV